MLSSYNSLCSIMDRRAFDSVWRCGRHAAPRPSVPDETLGRCFPQNRPNKRVCLAKAEGDEKGNRFLLAPVLVYLSFETREGGGSQGLWCGSGRGDSPEKLFQRELQRRGISGAGMASACQVKNTRLLMTSKLSSCCRSAR